MTKSYNSNEGGAAVRMIAAILKSEKKITELKDEIIALFGLLAPRVLLINTDPTSSVSIFLKGVMQIEEKTRNGVDKNQAFKEFLQTIDRKLLEAVQYMLRK